MSCLQFFLPEEYLPILHHNHKAHQLTISAFCADGKNDFKVKQMHSENQKSRPKDHDVIELLDCSTTSPEKCLQDRKIIGYITTS